MAFTLSSMTLRSQDFDAQGNMHALHARHGGNMSPAMTWNHLPEGTRSLAMFCHEPDARLVDIYGDLGFVHWLVYNIPSNVPGLIQGCISFTQGLNQFSRTGYLGPSQPDQGESRECYFWLVALDRECDLPEGLGLKEFMTLVEPHVLGVNKIVGHYSGMSSAPLGVSGRRAKVAEAGQKKTENTSSSSHMAA